MAEEVTVESVERVENWYHTFELPSGEVVKGFMDTRRAAADTPWPDLSGKRCLDVATYDGFWAFEMERLGAREVITLDLESTAELDWLPRRRHRAQNEPMGAGFRAARKAFGSSVERVTGNVYTLDPNRLGTFDVVFIGSLLVHLRSPFAALEAVRGVCDEHLVSMEPVDTLTTLVLRRRPILTVEGTFDWVWTTPNFAGHRRMLEVAGFDVETQRLTMLEYGTGAAGREQKRQRSWRWRAAYRMLGLTPAVGLTTSVAVARPSV